MSTDAQLSVYQHYNPTKYRIESYEKMMARPMG